MTEATKVLAEIVEEAGYGCRVVVTDPDMSLRQTVKGVLRGKPHQFCLKNAFWPIGKRIRYNPLVVHHGWNRQIIEREFEKMRDKRPIGVERARRGFFESYSVT